MAYNIEIKPTILKDITKSLKKDNIQISEITHKIYETFKELDDDKIWKSPEKKNYNEELMPYLKKYNQVITKKLDECTDQLDYALNSYLKENKKLELEAHKLSGVIEEL